MCHTNILNFIFFISRCKRIDITCSRDDIECFRKPSSYSFNFITFASNVSLPPQGRGLFNLRGPNWYDNIDFDFKIVQVDAPPYITKATEHYFRYVCIKEYNFVKAYSLFINSCLIYIDCKCSTIPIYII